MPTTFLGAKEYVNAAVNKIELMRGRDLPEMVTHYLVDYFGKIGEIKTNCVVAELKMLDNIPSNIIGAVERYAQKAQYHNEAQQYKPKDRNDLGDKESAGLIAEFLGEVLLWHELNLVDVNTDNPCGVMDIEQWVSIDRPKSWSPIIDDWLKGFESAYYLEKSQPGAISKFMRAYIDKIKSERTKRAA